MARSVKVFVTCDLCSAEVDEDDPQITHQFGYGGITYELDLCGEHGNEFVSRMMDYVTAGTEVQAPRAPKRQRAEGEPKAPRPGSKAADAARRKSELAAVRQWANANGYTLGDRGRISAEVFAAYTRATGIPVEQPVAPVNEAPVEVPVVDELTSETPAPIPYPDMWDEDGDDFAPAISGPAQGVRNPDGTPAG